MHHLQDRRIQISIAVGVVVLLTVMLLVLAGGPAAPPTSPATAPTAPAPETQQQTAGATQPTRQAAQRPTMPGGRTIEPVRVSGVRLSHGAPRSDGNVVATRRDDAGPARALLSSASRQTELCNVTDPPVRGGWTLMMCAYRFSTMPAEEPGKKGIVRFGFATKHSYGFYVEGGDGEKYTYTFDDGKVCRSSTVTAGCSAW